MKPLTLILTAFSVFIGCSIPRPDTELCVVNAPMNQMKCYNVRDDYDDKGFLLPNATPLYRPAFTVDDLNKYTVMDIASWANMKAYIKKMREEYENCKK